MKNGVLSNFTRSHISSDRVRYGYEIRINVDNVLKPFAHPTPAVNIVQQNRTDVEANVEPVFPGIRLTDFQVREFVKFTRFLSRASLGFPFSKEIASRRLDVGATYVLLFHSSLRLTES